MPVTLSMPGGEPVDAGSALLIMTLGAKYGDQIVVTSDDDATLEKIAGMVEQDLRRLTASPRARAGRSATLRA